VNAARDFDQTFARLRRGRSYAAGVPTGIMRLSHDVAGRAFPYTVEVPENYDRSRPYQVRFQLHGGVGRPENAQRGPGSIGALAGAEQIYVLPSAWDAVPWWHPGQMENLRLILDRLKRTYNVDENRVVISGVSDGGTGAYYLAMRDTTPYASFLPLNGFIMILANPSLGLREQMFPNNLRNKPFFVVNGGRDQLYPTSLVEPYVRHLQGGGVALTYAPQPEAGHNTAWWPTVKDTFERFVREHPRDPYPRTLTWEAEELEGGTSRAHWLRIDRLKPRQSEDPLPDLNERAGGTSPNFGVRATGMRITSVLKGSNADRLGLQPGDLIESINGRVIPEGVPLVDLMETLDAGSRLTLRVARDGSSRDIAGLFQPEQVPNVVALFPRPRASGRVDLVRDGNTIRATTRGVAAFTLLLSPDVFDFSRPISVVVDGRTAFEGRVEKSVETLMRWAAMDNDRTMLFGAELTIRP
jgi:pimeloyl-ACP methyl ester carboxylesterase